ncbi:MAG: STAS domain-containing protein [Magnetococcus sp. WYHC-3]
MFDFSIDDSGLLTLSGDLTIQHAAEVKEALLQSLEHAHNITLALAKVGRVDLAGLQLLCAFHRRLHAEGRILSVSGNIPDTLASRIALTGFENCLPGETNSTLWTGAKN